MKENVIWQNTKINKENREKIINQKGVVIWFTGLSGAGKSTIALCLEERLNNLGKLTYMLDGDNLRHGLNKDLNFTIEDRKENIRRVSEVAKLFLDSGIITLASFISPLRDDRSFARKIIGNNFIEVYVKCPINLCKERDPKGLYKKAEKGLIKNFTGIDSVYEEPINEEILIDTSNKTLDEEIDMIINFLIERNYLKIGEI